MSRRPVAATVGAMVLVATGCGSGSDAVCLSSGSGEVCAEGGDGRIEFSGSGLQPRSEVLFDSDQVGPVVLVADADGSLDPDGTTGVLSMFADTEFTFVVTAVDDQGEPIVGDLTVST